MPTHQAHEGDHMARSKGDRRPAQQTLRVDDDDSDDSEVRSIRSAASARRRGRPSGAGYDPATRSSLAESSVFGLVDSKGYRSERFYTRSTDKQGHGSKLQVRLPQGIDSQIHAAVAEIPEYRSAADFVRDAMIHRLEWIQTHYTMDPTMRRMVEMERHLTDMERLTTESQTLTGAVERVKLNLDIAYESKDWGLMKEALDQGDATVEWLREPYRSKADEIVREMRGRIREDLARWEKERDGE